MQFITVEYISGEHTSLHLHMSSTSPPAITMASASPQLLEASRVEDKMKAMFNNAPSSTAPLPSSPTTSPSLDFSDRGLSDLAPEQLEELTQDKTMCFSCRWEIPSSCLPSPCFHCDSPVCPTAPCLTEHLCKLCYTQERMDLERAEARRKTSQQMDKMLEMFRWRFSEAEVGTPVLLAIPGVDKGCCMFPSLLCVVLEKYTGGLYKLGCKTGKLEGLYSRNQFSPAMPSFPKVEEVNMEREVLVRTAAREGL